MALGHGFGGEDVSVAAHGSAPFRLLDLAANYTNYTGEVVEKRGGRVFSRRKY
jgi:hypothetical protein